MGCPIGRSVVAVWIVLCTFADPSFALKQGRYWHFGEPGFERERVYEGAKNPDVHLECNKEDDIEIGCKETKNNRKCTLATLKESLKDETRKEFLAATLSKFFLGRAYREELEAFKVLLLSLGYKRVVLLGHSAMGIIVFLLLVITASHQL